MFRFIAFLLGREYEPCKTCYQLLREIKYLTDQLESERQFNLQLNETETQEVKILREQLNRLENQNAQLLDRLLKLSEPEIVPTNITVVPPKPKARTWNAVRIEKEAQDRIATEVVGNIEKLEKELEINNTEQDINKSA